MRLGIDLDGVVANFISGWMTRYNTEFGASLTEDMVDHWDAAADLTHFPDIADFWRWAGAAGNGATIFRDLPTYPVALPALEELAVEHDIVVLSTKPDWAAADTFKWLGDRAVPTREVHFLRDKWRVACDIYLDDSPYVLPELVKHRPESLICRYLRPWNSPVSGTRDIGTWDEFCDLVGRHTPRWSQAG